MSGTLKIAPEVAERIGPEITNRVLNDDHSFICMMCQRPGDTQNGQEASLIAVIFNDASKEQLVLRLAHAKCSESCIKYTSEPLLENPDDVREEDNETLAFIAPAGFFGPHPVAAIIIERDDSFQVLTPSGDSITPWSQQLLSTGWTLLTEWPPPMTRAIKNWKCSIDRRAETGTIEDGQDLLIDRFPPLPPGWIDIAVRNQRVLAITTHGFHLTQEVTTAERLFAALERHLKKGNTLYANLPVTTAQVTRRQPPTASRNPAAESIAQRFADTANILDWPAQPHLIPVVIEDLPVLLVDVPVPSDEIQPVLDVLIQHGWRKETAPGEQGPWPFVQEDWGYILWPNQVLLLAPRPAPHAEPRKLLIEPMNPTPTWYDQIRNSGHGAMGVAVGSFHLTRALYGEDPSDLVFGAMAKGNVAIAVFAGMCMQ